LAKGCEQRGFTVDIVITNARTPRVFESVEAKDRGGLAEYRNAYIRRMQAATAENAIPAVTCLHRRTGRSFGRADVSIFDRLRDGVARRVIAAWQFSVRDSSSSPIYSSAFAGIEIVHPLPDEINATHTNDVDLAAAGKRSPEKRDKLTAIAKDAGAT
jgi:hypothetical protein